MDSCLNQASLIASTRGAKLSLKPYLKREITISDLPGIQKDIKILSGPLYPKGQVGHTKKISSFLHFSYSKISWKPIASFNISLT